MRNALAIYDLRFTIIHLLAPLQQALEVVHRRWVAQTRQRSGLDLPHAFACDTEADPDIRERAGRVGIQPVPEYKNPTLAFVEPRDRLREFLGSGAVGDPGERVLSIGVRHEVSKFDVAVVTDTRDLWVLYNGLDLLGVSAPQGM